MDKEFKLGVYIKQNGGKLVTVEVNKDYNTKERWPYLVINGDKNNSFPYNLLKPNSRPLAYITSSSLRLGWGPTAYLKKCDYLGDL